MLVILLGHGHLAENSVLFRLMFSAVSFFVFFCLGVRYSYVYVCALLLVFACLDAATER